ncbi:hypothetical protein JCM10914A_09940 [Paenibacillus sp. JCM 10914]|uniref:alginate lyase family protein n=1 Tax=Paenibacillus sp. JCM 10914 TaxID=1236974 RepID=UPI0003CC84BE|nr:alginate lyase family protein [Paenibacillus sp. JCM 10914]GAE07316.1 hypothetical protein JCM10914_3539 [Paenibacillus sp. JCM 10914]
MSSLITKWKRLTAMPLHTAGKKVAGTAISYTVYELKRLQLQRQPVKLDVEQFAGFRTTSSYYFDPVNQDVYKEQLRLYGVEQQIMQDAEAICQHRFNLLGSGDILLGEPINWTQDFKTGHQWPQHYYKRIKTVNLRDAADVKVPWELSRFQHVFTLGKAYWLSGDDRYLLEFQRQTDSWIVQNPVEMSVNWACTMDVAIRAFNWLSGAWFFRRSYNRNEPFWNRFNASLYLHGIFIMNNLENQGEVTGNHYLSNLVGLVALGLYFSNFSYKGEIRHSSTPEQWLSYGLRELEREMLVQVNEDGTNYEASTSYHRLVTEMLLLITILCERNDITFSQEFRKKLEAMCCFIRDMAKPDGLTPLVGDADDGRLLITSRYGSWVRNDYRHLLAVAGEWFQNETFRQAAGLSDAEDALWITGIAPSPDKKHEPCSELTSIAYPDGGYYMLRNDSAYCMIRCGELSFRGQGAHSHNDQLSIELQVSGKDYIVDPGTYVYTADYRMRNYFRSTAMHNTLEINGQEQNEFDEDIMFLMREQTDAVCERFDQSHFSGYHHGYVDKCGMLHRREIQLTEGGLEINDELIRIPAVPTDESITYAASFVMSPKVKLTLSGTVLQAEVDNTSLRITFHTSSDQVELLPCWVSTRYGVKEASHVVRVKGSSSGLRTSMDWSVREGGI